MKIANFRAREYTTRKEPFVGNNTFATWIKPGSLVGNVYVVYSYRHWPLYIFKEGQWYENKNKYSKTTSKHHNQLRPQADTIKLTVEQMKELLRPSDY